MKTKITSSHFVFAMLDFKGITKIIFLFVVFHLFQNKGIAQTMFQKTIGQPNFEERCTDVELVTGISTSGYIICGFTDYYGAGSDDVYLIKTNNFGDTIWTKTYGGTASDMGNEVEQTADGGFIVVGNTTSFGAGATDIYVIKTDINGDTLWTKTYGGINSESGNSVRQTTDGGYIIAGATASYGTLSEGYVIKTNSVGDTLWTKTYGGIDNDEFNSVKQTTDGGYILCGESKSFGLGVNYVYLVKTDSLGNVQWSGTYGGTVSNYGAEVQQTTYGGYAVGGSIWTSKMDVLLFKTNASGLLTWSKVYGGQFADQGYSMQQTSDGGYIVSGMTDAFTFQSSIDVYVVKTNSIGDTLWTKVYGAITDMGNSVRQTPDGGYIIGGHNIGFNLPGYYSKDIYLIKTDALGNSGCHQINPHSHALNITLLTSTPVTTVGSGGIVTNPRTQVHSKTITVGDACNPSVATNELIAEDEQIIIAPNPFSNQTIITSAKYNIQRIKIMDVLGNIVRSEEFGVGRKEAVIEKGELSNGIYFVQITDENRDVVNRKIVVQ